MGGMNEMAFIVELYRPCLNVFEHQMHPLNLNAHGALQAWDGTVQKWLSRIFNALGLPKRLSTR